MEIDAALQRMTEQIGEIVTVAKTAVDGAA
jgi:hypothetical protein